jgi:hypothetical protein
VPAFFVPVAVVDNKPREELKDSKRNEPLLRSFPSTIMGLLKQAGESSEEGGGTPDNG